MKLAVFHNLPYGGALRVVNEQIDRLNTRHIDIYTYSKTTNYDFSGCNVVLHTRPFHQIELLKSPFGKLNGLINLQNLKKLDKANKELAKEIDNANYDAVLVHPCRISQAPSILRHLKTPSVYYCHEYFRAVHEAPIRDLSSSVFANPFRAIYEQSVIINEQANMNAVTKVITNSYHTRESVLSAYGIDSIVNYPGVDTKLFTPDNNMHKTHLLSVGRLSLVKGHDFIIKSLSLVPASIRPELIIACGDSPQASFIEYQKLADNLQVKIKFMRELTDQALVHTYNGAIATLVASVLEPLGLVSLESGACGTPVVAVKEAGLRETVLDGVTGFLTDRIPQKFADAIIKILNNSNDAHNMGLTAREYVLKNWNWEISILQLKDVLSEVSGRG